MAQDSSIEWTDATWPVVQGCDYDSPGCTNCYAVPLLWRMAHNPNPKIAEPLQGLVEKSPKGKLSWTGKVKLRADRLAWPADWMKPSRIFLPSHGDLFHEAVPDAFIDQVFTVMEVVDRHTYQLLTKRSERQRDYVRRRYADSTGRAPLHIWFGVSIEDQERASRLQHLRDTPAIVRFVSAEPLLGPLVLGLDPNDERGREGTISQVICGGESGTRKRPTDPAWHRALRDECKAANVAFFEKQIDKVQPIPADLMVREFPEVA